jgi:hypothetical protein
MSMRRWRRLLVHGGILPIVLLFITGTLLLWIWVTVFGMWLRVPWYPGQSVSNVYWRAFLYATKAGTLALLACVSTGLAVLTGIWRR